MIVFGLLLVLGAGGLSVAAILANRGAFEAAAGPVELFGYQADMTVGQVFGTGAAAGAITLLGFIMLFGGIGRRARRRAATRRELVSQRNELKELQRKQDSEPAAQHADGDKAVDVPSSHP